MMDGTRPTGERFDDSSVSPRMFVNGARAQLLDSAVDLPEGAKLLGATSPQDKVNVSLLVRSKAPDAEFDATLQKIVNHESKPLNAKDLESRFGIDGNALQHVLKFAGDNSLKVDDIDKNSGRVLVTGSVADVCKAFEIKLEDYEKDGQVVRGRKGVISVPENIAKDVLGVFGLETSSQANAHFVRLPEPGPFSPRATFAHFPDEFAEFYHFPKESMGAGQSVGILEFAGGLDLDDNKKYYTGHKFPLPKINMVTVDGGKNDPGQDADTEVALDSQIIGVIAPDATQQLVFAPNTDQGFIDAISRATFAKPGEKPNSAISISWGAPEPTWSAQTVKAMDMAFKRAAMMGISVFASSGDNGAPDRAKDDKLRADFPGSDPYVTSTGGTRTYLEQNREIAWDEGEHASTGGGISEIFAVPEYQKDVNMPANANGNGKLGRGVPDIAGNASANSGYFTRSLGRETTIGGTSAVAPLYAGLMMRINGALGTPVGDLNPFLYNKENRGIFRDITEGGNHGYVSAPGWDPVTGWGSVYGDRMLNLLRANQKHQ